MKKSLVDRIRSGARGLVVGGVVGVAGLGVGVAKADIPAGAIPIKGFRDFTGIVSSGGTVKTSRPEGNFKVRDPNGVVQDVELDSHWHIGFINYSESGGGEVVGYAENRWSGFEGWEGFMYGDYVKIAIDREGNEVDVLGHNERPEDVWIVHDSSGDGIGYVFNSYWYLNKDDTLYFSRDIEFNSIQGDVSQLPATDYINWSTLYLPQMTIYVRPPRTGPAGINELTAIAENWLSEDCHPYNNSDCDGDDWNFDGKVNFVDFSHMVAGWDPTYISE